MGVEREVSELAEDDEDDCAAMVEILSGGLLIWMNTQKLCTSVEAARR
jgi:hypothetical protein